MDFDLLFHRDEQQTYLRVLNSPGGEAQGVLNLDTASLTITDVVAELRHYAPGVHPDLIKSLGAELFSAIFLNQSIYGRYQSSLTAVDGTPLRITMRLKDVPDLAELPWEYLYDESIEAFVALSNETPIVRYIEVPSPTPSIELDHPLRILVTLSSPTDLSTLDVETEWQRLSDSLAELQMRGLVELVRLAEPTLGALRNALRENDYHIFHFIGHGDYDLNQSSGGLMFVDKQGKSDYASADSVGTLLTDHHSLLLAVLNACEGGRSSNTHVFAGVGQKLVQQGVPACVAMQFPVTDASAMLFAHEFYRALVDGYTIEAATTDARKAISSERKNVEWGTSVIFTRLDSVSLFPKEKRSEESMSGDSSQNVSIGGNNSGNINISKGDININKSSGNRTYNFGNVGGDFVAGDQIIHGDKVHGDKVGTPALLDGLIAEVMRTAQNAQLDQDDVEDLEDALADFKKEAEQPDASEKKIGRLLRRLEDFGPFAVEIIVNALLNPGAAVADGVRAGIQLYKQTKS